MTDWTDWLQARTLLVSCLGLDRDWATATDRFWLLDIVLEHLVQAGHLERAPSGQVRFQSQVLEGRLEAPTLQQWLGDGWRGWHEGLVGLVICLGLGTPGHALDLQAVSAAHDEDASGWLSEMVESLAVLTDDLDHPGPAFVLAARGDPDTPQVRWQPSIGNP